MLKNLIEQFIISKINDCTPEYYYLLRIIYKNVDSTERYLSTHIKETVNSKPYTSLQLKNKLRGVKYKLSSLKIDNLSSLSKTFSKIKEIQLKDFRSFGHFGNDDKGVRFEFEQNKNILFAPNGGGKSSFCEALEYELTGDIKEAKRRNIPINKYIKYQGSHTPKNKIIFVDAAYSMTDIDRSAFKHAFIEKNRLNEFALLGSKDTGIGEKDILAILLDLEELDEFISKFVQPNSLRLEDYKSTLLQEKHQQSQKNIEDANKDNIELIQKIKALNKEKKLITIRNELRELKNKEGLLHESKGKLKSKKVNFHEEDELYNHFFQISIDMFVYKKLVKKLNSKKNEQDYKQLYEAVKNLSDLIIESNKCPLCNTSFVNVVKNPIDNANEQLVKLAEIVELTTEKEEFDKQFENSFESLNKIEINMNNNIQNIEELKDFKINFLEEKDVDKIVSLDKKFQKVKFENLDSYFKIIKDTNDEINNSSVKIKEIDTEIKNIQQNITSLNMQISIFKTYSKQFISNKIKIEKSYKEIELKEDDLNKENEFNLFIDNLIESYKVFKKDIENFKLSLEEERLKNIEKDTLSYYNQINSHDDKSEYLTDIKFVKNTTKYNIEIEINAEKKDAFLILSEGHLRSLGLSIILALIKKLNIPFLIFDDVVNAIDSEHRANIIEMLYHDKSIKDKQLIITTHDRLFWERFSHLHHDVNKLKSFILKYTNHGTVYYLYDVDFRLKIEHALNYFDIRQALLFCRIWFETEVINYCIYNKKELTGNFTSTEKGNLLKPSLEKIYRDIILKEFGTNKNLKIIRDGLNWNIQNQEHHTFDENTYNIVHSKTSDEVIKIYKAIDAFVFILFLEREEERINEKIKTLFSQYDNKHKLSLKEGVPIGKALKFHNEKDEIATLIMEEIKNKIEFKSQHMD